MELKQVPEKFKKNLQHILDSKDVVGEFIVGMVKQALEDASTWEEFTGTLSNDLASCIQDMKRIEELLS